MKTLGFSGRVVRPNPFDCWGTLALDQTRKEVRRIRQSDRENTGAILWKKLSTSVHGGKLKDMKIILKTGEQVLGTADWDHLPDTGGIVLLATAIGLTPEARIVDKIDDDPSGGKTVYVGDARPTFVFS